MNNTQVTATEVVSDQPTIRTTSSAAPPEVSGYQLTERIGVGGYGEVWRAIGPGGFPKAVKLLYGQTDGPQAETELKSLNLMRELRHPFLLNVERVEFLDGRLVVVTELADHSLDQHFRQVVRNGARGIPRDELLAYLRDVADALDFMSEHHGLQHLDIKPENLLIQGNHAKVGDFGLTKSLGLTTASIVNGFTPLYAPPELFDGQPSSNSDQYSLAIVYQTMLTGAPPFNGRTAAQLTSQHLRSTPDLTALPSSDRGVVARALSKNPHARFSGCRQFIDELGKRKAYSGAAMRVIHGDGSSEVPSLTQNVDPATFGKTPSTPLRPSRPLPPQSVRDQPLQLRPTIFVGVGGLGARIISLLEVKLREEFDGHLPPAIGLLCLDTDKSVITRKGQHLSTAAESAIEQLLISLRPPLEYRKSASNPLNWLSRRWLFNIPRSGNVEGMRPLGRLAFVDHQQRVRESFSKLLKSVTGGSAIATSTCMTGAEYCSDDVDICLVGSTSGGTSSGCLIDLGFMIRRLLDRGGRRSSQITAMLLHSTSAGGQRSDAQDANSCSFLKELNFYSLPGAQVPIDGQSMMATGRIPFETTYFVHFGDDLTTADYDRHVQHLGVYLQLWAVSPERRILDSWRAAEKGLKEDPDELTIRTLGYATIDELTWNSTTSESETLALQTVCEWLAKPTARGDSVDYEVTDIADRIEGDTSSETAALIDVLGLTSEKMRSLVPELLGGDLSRRIDHYSADVWKRISSNSVLVADRVRFVESLTTMISDDAAAGTMSTDSITRIAQSVRHTLNSRMQTAFQKIQQRLLQDLDSDQRLWRASGTIRILLSQMEKVIEYCSGQKADVQRGFSGLCAEFTGSSAAGPSHTKENAARHFCQQYCMLLLCQTVFQCVMHFLNSLKEFLSRQQTETLADVEQQLHRITGFLGHGKVDVPQIPQPTLSAFESFLQMSEQFRLSAVLRSEDCEERFAATLAAAAANFMMSEDFLSQQPEGTSQNGRDSFPLESHPILSNVGGGRRVLARIPDEMAASTWKPRLEAEFGDCIVLQKTAQPEISVFCEVEGIYLPAILDSLTHLRPRVAEMAERVHSRNDISF